MSERKYKLVSVGKGLGLYRVVRNSDNFSIGATVSNCGCTSNGGYEKPWEVRWMDFYSVQHVENFRTRVEVVAFLEKF